MASTPTRDQLTDHFRREWLCERATAETVRCRPKPWGCGADVDETCINLHTGRLLEGPPAHLCRIRDAATAAVKARAAAAA